MCPIYTISLKIEKRFPQIWSVWCRFWATMLMLTFPFCPASIGLKDKIMAGISGGQRVMCADMKRTTCFLYGRIEQIVPPEAIKELKMSYSHVQSGVYVCVCRRCPCVGWFLENVWMCFPAPELNNESREETQMMGPRLEPLCRTRSVKPLWTPAHAFLIFHDNETTSMLSVSRDLRPPRVIVRDNSSARVCI